MLAGKEIGKNMVAVQNILLHFYVSAESCWLVIHQLRPIRIGRCWSVVRQQEKELMSQKCERRFELIHP